MKALRLTVLIVLGIGLSLVSGCKRAHSEAGVAEAHEHGKAEPQPEEAGVTFKQGKGLHVPEATARFIGLQIEDVTEGKVAAKAQFSAQVYRATSEARFAALEPSVATTALASASVGPAVATALRAGQTVRATLGG